mmetsp:Transcript_29009/g.67498  ORF Transcript_29009/g.67498 Transcript_29009/m.67498 type:complete len:220 (+) Transcript_29009:189-848(+)
MPTEAPSAGSVLTTAASLGLSRAERSRLRSSCLLATSSPSSSQPGSGPPGIRPEGPRTCPKSGSTSSRGTCLARTVFGPLTTSWTIRHRLWTSGYCPRLRMQAARAWCQTSMTWSNPAAALRKGPSLWRKRISWTHLQIMAPRCLTSATSTRSWPSRILHSRPGRATWSQMPRTRTLSARGHTTCPLHMTSTTKRRGSGSLATMRVGNLCDQSRSMKTS